MTLVLPGSLLLMGLAAMPSAADPGDQKVPPARQAVEPAAPSLPGDLVATLQAGKYGDAIKGLDALAADPKADADTRAYLGIVKAVAQRLDRKLDDARTTLQAALKLAPEGKWAVKIRSELARTELQAMRPVEAEKLAQAEVRSLLADDRKDSLAGVYRDFARKLIEPDEPTTPPDPNAAYDLLAQARELAKGETLRARLLFEMAVASQKANNLPRALQDFTTYVRDYPKGADRFAARFHKGEVELATGQPVPARLTWADLARALEKQDDQALADLRARSLYQIALTHGIPRPGDDTNLNLGVAALRRFLAAYPSHPLAVKAAYQIGESYLNRGKSDQAYAALVAFLKGEGYKAEGESARRELAQLAPLAQFQAGQVLQSQQKFDEAIAAYRAYLAKYPDGPQSADAQRAILATELQAAADYRRREQFDKARAAWRAFVAAYPLDGNVPGVLFAIGESFEAEKKHDEAIAAWETLAGKFPGSEPAGHAEFQIALILEVEKGDPVAAIERYRKIAVEPWKGQANQRIAVMEAKSLQVVTPRAFRSGETPKLKITSRNLESLAFAAYRIDAESYFRKKHQTCGVESLDIGLVAPDFEWSLDVPGYARYKPIEREYELNQIPVPGVFAVKVTNTTDLQSTTLVIGSDIDVIVKASRDQVLVFAQDMKGGGGRPNARVLLSDGSGVFLEGKTGEDGVMLKNWEKPRDPGSPLTYLVVDGPNVAGSGLSLPGSVAQGLTPRAYIASDRPAYRPGQTAELRGVVREVKDGQYDFSAGSAYKFEVYDSRGRQIVNREVRLSEFGTFHQSVTIDEGAPVGSYRVRAFKPGGSDFSGSFEVQAYQLQKVDLTLDLPRLIYFRGEKVEATAIAKYQYGTPLAGRPIAVQLPDGRTLSGSTDAAGKFPIAFETEGFGEEQVIRLTAHLPQENVAVSANLMVAVRAFRIDVATDRPVYIAGESIPVRVASLDVQGEPTAQDLSVRLIQQINRNGIVSEREVARQDVKTDAKTGKATVTLSAKGDEGGSFLVRVAGTDRFGNPIVADRALTISGKDDDVKVRLLADRPAYKVGEEVKVNLHNRAGAGTALVAWEADRILKYKVLKLQEGDNPIAWEATGAEFPNFTLTAGRMAESKFHQARLDLAILRDLTVTLTPKKPNAGPGEAVEVEVTTRDQLGRPVAAEVSVALVDRALLRLYQDKLPPIGGFFYNQSRVGAFTTESTNTFRYEPPTVAVSRAVVEERAQSEARLRDKLQVDLVKEQLQKQMADAPAPAMNFAVNTPDAAKPASADARYYARFRDESGNGLASGEAMVNRWADAYGSNPEDALGVDRKDADFDDALGDTEALGRRKLSGKMDIAAKKSESKGRPLGGGGRGPGGQPRQQYVETAYWNPSVVTDKDGKATIKLTAPTALSEYRFTARGTTGSDTLVGQSTAEFAVRKDFFVELKAPAILTQGDKPRFLGRLHHSGVKGKAEVRLNAYAGGAEKVMPKTIELTADGVEELQFDAFDVVGGDMARLTLSARIGDASDEITVEVPIQPWGQQAIASASGTTSDTTTAFVQLPAGRAYEEPEMLIVLSPSTKRMLIELALGRDAFPIEKISSSRFMPPPPRTTADKASDLLSAAAALAYLRATRAADAPEAARLGDRISGLVTELIASQCEDGGWSWVPGPGKAGDRMTTAHVAWGLASAEKLGMLPDPTAAEKAAAYLSAEFAKVDGSDHEGRAAILHALSARGKASFEQANGLNRVRQNLSNVALAYLALTFANLDRATLADEVLGVLIPKGKPEPAQPGQPPRRYWEGNPAHAWCRDTVEATALACLAIARARPQAEALDQGIAWLNSHRSGNGWQPHKARGAALSAMGLYYAKGQAAEDRYNLVIRVNDAEIQRLSINGQAQGQAIRVPRRVLKPTEANRVALEIEGRGTLGYAVTLTGFTRDFKPDQDRANRSMLLDRRVYLASQPELDGQPLPAGFGVAVNATAFENKVSQVALGGRAHVSIQAHRIQRTGMPAWEQEFLVVRDRLPAGATLVEGSVQSQASYFEQADGMLTFYFAPEQYPGSIGYDIHGYLPGDYRALPPEIRSAYDPGRFHLGPEGSLRVLAAGEAATDPYKATPDELYARGKALFERGQLEPASKALEELFTSYTLQENVAKDTVRMMLVSSIRSYDAGKVVRYFEVLKEKAPELVIPFDQIVVVGRAYRDLGEAERAYLVWRAVAEASYLEDARVGEVLRQRGKPLQSVAYLLDLWRSYPDTAPIESDFFGLSQVVANLAARAIDDASIRKELASAEVTKSALLAQSIRLTQTFLALSPKNPLADEASLALIGSSLELEDFPMVVKLARRFAELYPKSTFQDSFQYSEALGRFHLGEYDRAVEVAEKIAAASYKDANGVDQPSPNKWQAIYILGQIHDARRQPGKAVEYYRQVADRFTDAAGAAQALTRTDLKLPEVTVIRPRVAVAAAADGEGFRALPAARPAEESSVKLEYRNIARADLKVYKVDLMQLYLTRRNLDGIAGIDLAGITPLVEKEVELGDGADFEDKTRAIPLPIDQEGAYLVMVRGDNLYTSGIALVSPLELEVTEDAGAGRVRVVVRDARTKDFVPKVQVKVIGGDNPEFLGGMTDLRGVFVAEGVRGQVTAVARQGTGRYAFYRGTQYVGSPPVPQAPAAAPTGQPQVEGQSLESNIRGQNFDNQSRQLKRLEERYNQAPARGVQVEKAY
ncbi:MAG: MG2 domain-containing protein [Isosphaeraceae bacterium]